MVIPGVNDSPEVLHEIANRIASELGAEIPWHLSAYQPATLFKAPPTPLQLLQQARDMGKQAGLHYVYIGNLPGNPFENTCCPGCGQLLISRIQYDVSILILKDGRCRNCAEVIPGVW